MRILRSEYSGRQYLEGHNFELTHPHHNPRDIGEHFHDCYEVSFIKSVIDVNYIIEGKHYEPRSGDIVIINKFDVHKLVSDKDLNYDRIVLRVASGFVESLSTETSDLCQCFRESLGRNKNLLRMTDEMLNPINSVLGKLEKEYSRNNFGDDILLKSYLAEILVLLNRVFLNIKDEEPESEIITNRTVNKVLKYINDNLEKELTLEVLSNTFFVSKYHLIREFKKNVGYTVHQYILIKRLLMAEKMLKENIPATQIYSYCGFKNYSTFMRSFMKHYGITPGQFSKKTTPYK